MNTSKINLDNVELSEKSKNILEATKGQKGQTSEIMPVPTVMILDEKGKILGGYHNPNYKERISGEMLLAVLKTLKS